MIDDAALPVLRDLSPEALSRLSGVPETTLLRLRYRRGKRAILHVSSPLGEGALWTFAGDKGKRIARRHKSSRLDEGTSTVFDPFPNDHRLPQIAGLIGAWPVVAPALIGTEAAGDLHLLRYRPGLSCTFRARGADGRTCYIKVVGDDDVTALARANARVGRALAGRSLGIAPALAIAPEFRAISYAAAPGSPLDVLLQGPSPNQAMETAIAGVDRLHALPPVSRRRKGGSDLRAVADAARDMVNTIFPALTDLTAAVMRRLDPIPQMELCQIHGDMKLEHVFLDAGRVTLIDTETMAIGPAAYDLAMLDGRLLMAVQDGLPLATAKDIRARIARRADPAWDWCRAVVALRLAKFHAQHPGPGAEERAAALLRDLP